MVKSKSANYISTAKQPGSAFQRLSLAPELVGEELGSSQLLLGNLLTFLAYLTF